MIDIKLVRYYVFDVIILEIIKKLTVYNMKTYIISCIVFIFFACKTDKQNIIDDAYKSEFKAYKKQGEKNRVNYLQLTGLFKLDSLENTFGKDTINDFVLQINSLPKTIGTISVLKDDLTFNASKYAIVKTQQDSVVTKLSLQLNEYGSSIKLYHEQLNWQIITRAGSLYLRVWDIKNPAISTFKGFELFNLNPDFILDGQFTYYDTTKTEEVHSQLGVNTRTNFIGNVVFIYKDQSYSLDVGQNGFTMVNDLTSGNETYGGGRYIYLDLPKTDSIVHLDFNRLYNPPCAFSEFTTCLYPPRQNHLQFEVLAGEKIIRKN